MGHTIDRAHMLTSVCARVCSGPCIRQVQPSVGQCLRSFLVLFLGRRLPLDRDGLLLRAGCTGPCCLGLGLGLASGSGATISPRCLDLRAAISTPCFVPCLARSLVLGWPRQLWWWWCVCVCVCVRARARERERERGLRSFSISHCATASETHTLLAMCAVPLTSTWGFVHACVYVCLRAMCACVRACVRACARAILNNTRRLSARGSASWYRATSIL